jgi:hypothetical protein
MSEEPEHTPYDPVSSLMQREASARHLSAVGAVASLWANFELTIDRNTVELGRLPVRAGHCLTAQIAGSARKMDAYIAIARLRGADKFADPLDKFSKDTASLAERRNRVVHDPWFFSEIDSAAFAQRHEVTARRKLRLGFILVEMEEIARLASDIYRHMEAFAVLHHRISAVVNT